MEEHRASMQTYNKVHKETVRSGLRMTIVQQSMEMDIYDIKQVLAHRWEQMGIRSYRVEEDQRREEMNQKIEELKNLIQSFIQDPISPTVTIKEISRRPLSVHTFGAVNFLFETLTSEKYYHATLYQQRGNKTCGNRSVTRHSNIHESSSTIANDTGNHESMNNDTPESTSAE
ncbi:hypothetical protein Tco_1103555 [Tanacetum coccineum]